jgi:hypothetical protein
VLEFIEWENCIYTTVKKKIGYKGLQMWFVASMKVLIIGLLHMNLLIHIIRETMQKV